MHRPRLCILLFFLGLLGAVCGRQVPDEDGLYMWHQRRAMANAPHYQSPRALNTSSAALKKAQDTVAAAVAQQSKYNAYRVANPRRNTNEPPPKGGASASRKRADEPPAPVLTSGLRAAAAMLAEHNARQRQANGTLHRSYSQFRDLPKPLNVSKRATLDYWPPLVDHGMASMGTDPSFAVYRDVTDPMFGAKGDGVTDDTDAINAAIAYGNTCMENCLSSTVKGTFIYFPPGTYLISSPINAAYYSQLVGNPIDMPIIKTAPNFIGLGAIQSDVYIPNGNGGEWYIVQSNFYRQVRNFIIDITETTTALAAGLHWQVAQATSLTNVFILANSDKDTTQMGMFTENGSGGFMSDCSIAGGKYGIYGGNQQYTVRDFQITAQTNASICLIWDWGWTWANMFISNSPVGISLIDPESPGGQQAGSTYILDSQFSNTPIAIQATFESKSMLNTSVITLDNVAFLGSVDNIVQFTDSNLGLTGSSVNFVIIGNIEQGSAIFQGYYHYSKPPTSPSLQDPSKISMYHDIYFYKSRPQYEDLEIGDIVSVKDHGAKGDGVTDDTNAIISALAAATTDNLIYFPPGSYIVTSTINVPPNARITGQVWSQIVASGDYFADQRSPKPMLRIGLPGDVGTVEISDLLFTSIGNLPGLVLVEWNVQAKTKGSVGIWDAHFRIGGAIGTELQLAQCPSSAPLNGDACVAASALMHMTPGSNGYFENMWLWVADHDIDDAANKQISIAVARGLLVDSTSGPTWFYGTASEHAMLYQYNFFNATDTFAGMIQTESPYFQFADGIAQSPGPFSDSVGLFSGDPSFPDETCNGTDALCNFSWAVMMQQNTNLTIAGAGLYSWYDNYLEECVDTQNCQQRLVQDAGYNSGAYIFNLVTIGAVEMISDVSEDNIIYAVNNTQASGHPFWSALAAYTDSGSVHTPFCDDDDDSDECATVWDCDLTRSYANIDDLNAALTSYPDQCMPYYAIDTLHTVISDSMTNYTVANDDYDKYFGYYREYVRDLVPNAIAAFMAESTPNQVQGGPGNKYFDCTCEGYGPTSTQQCPFTYTQLAGALGFKMTYTLKDSDGFYAELASTYGVDKSWVVFKKKGGIVRNIGHCTRRDDCVTSTDYEWINFPQAAGSGDINPANPKDVVTSALPTIDDMMDNILATTAEMYIGAFNGSILDVPDTFSMPVFLIQQAVQSMATVKQLGEEQAKRDKINLILEILGIVFAFLPFVDDFVPALAVLDGVLETISVAGSVALDIQSIIADPTSAPMLLLDLVGGGAGRELKSGDDFASAAAAARLVTEDDLSAMGAEFKAKQDKFKDETTPHCAL